MPVGHHNMCILQRDELCKRTVCTVVTVFRHVPMGISESGTVQCKKISHVAKMAFIIRLMG